MTKAPSHRSVRRSLRGWALRGGIAAVALVLGYVSTTQTLAYVIHKSKVERAHALAPADGRITAKLAEKLATSDVDAAQRSRIDRLARQALAQEPLAVPAITALALDAQLRGDTGRARRLFVHSDALSRRELAARLWLIEDAVERGDVPSVLRHYDIALRTSMSAADLLFPVLSSAIADPTIAGPLVETLSSRPTWADAFVFQLGTVKTDPIVRAAFLGRLIKHSYAIPQATQFGVINDLVLAGAVDEAWTLYAALRPGVSRSRSRDPDFVAQLQTPTAFDWTAITNETGVSASIQSARGGGIFEFSAPSTVGGVVLQQTQSLPPGRYRLEGISAEIDQVAASRPYWQLVCGDGRDTGRVELPNSAENGGRFAGEMVVGAGCEVQTLRLVARPSSAVGGVMGRLKRVSLSPVEQVR